MGVVAPIGADTGGGGGLEGGKGVGNRDVAVAEFRLQRVEEGEARGDGAADVRGESGRVELLLFGDEEDDEGDTTFAEAIGYVRDNIGNGRGVGGIALGEISEVFAVEEDGAVLRVVGAEDVVWPGVEEEKANGGPAFAGDVGGEGGLGKVGG